MLTKVYYLEMLMNFEELGWKAVCAKKVNDT